MTEHFQAIVVEPTIPADACVVWLHGLGANGHDFADAPAQLTLPRQHAIRFIFPHAPEQPVTINNHLQMPAWFDILGLTATSPQDTAGIQKAHTQLCRFLHQIIDSGIPSERIILVGFSQGGALALYTALRFDKPLAGVASLSAYLPLAERLAKEVSPANRDLAIFMAHGMLDPVVSFWLGEASLSHLVQAGFEPSWHTYPIAHTVSLQEFSDLGAWMQNQLDL